MTKKLYKSRSNRIDEYFKIDPTIIRLVWAVLILVVGVGLLAYIIAALIIPEIPDGTTIVE